MVSSTGARVAAFTLRPRHTDEERKETHKYIVPGTGDAEGVVPEAWFSADDDGLKEFLTWEGGLDWLIITLPLTPQTTSLVGKTELELLSKSTNNKTDTGAGAFITNISRGKILDQASLLHHLKLFEDTQGREGLRGAALDVTEPEPLPEGDELWDAPNLVMSAHVSGESEGYVGRALRVFEVNYGREARGVGVEGWVNVVDRGRGY